MHTEPETPRSGGRLANLRWRVATAGVLFVCTVWGFIGYSSSDGADLRPDRYEDLSVLVSKESRRVQGQQADVAALKNEVARLTTMVSDDSVREAQTRADSVAVAAGFGEVTGPAVTITLTDAPHALAVSAPGGIEAKEFVVHQQDIQAVVNAMWVGGAKAVTVQGQRIISTTGIKCEGSFVTLQGVPYPPPYVISGVGELEPILAAIQMDQRLTNYRIDAANPAIAIGWNLATEAQVTVPAYDARVELPFATIIK